MRIVVVKCSCTTTGWPARSTVLLAVVPQASMGTAIEMWEAHQQGRVVITISPLAHNWVVRFLSDVVYPTYEEFEAAVVEGRSRGGWPRFWLRRIEAGRVPRPAVGQRSGRL